MKAPRPALPVPLDAGAAVRRLAREEETLRGVLAGLEERVRRFEDVERPAYDAWVRLELGPLFADLAERSEVWRARDLFVARLEELIDVHGVDPREALWLVTEAHADAERPGDRRRRREDVEAEQREEIEARRRAKRERKRAERKEARRARGKAKQEAAAPERGEPSRRRLSDLYRALARRLHPDSPTVIVFDDPQRGRAVWMEVQAAYGARSLERLLAISAWIETGPAADVDAARTRETRGSLLSLAERHDRLRALRRSCRALERRLDELAREPAWEFPAASASARRKLRQAAARRLEGERAQMEDALAALEEFIASLGSPRPPRAARRRR